jgi:calcineurin-like phosphoesterase family protein
MNTYFTSDTHFGHKNIVRGTTTWEFDPKEGAGVQKLRDFDTLEEHNAALVKSINALVKYDDELWHLGDWSFGGHENIRKFRDQLNCRNIHLVFGNHDQHIEPINSPYRGCFSSCQYYKELSFKIDSKKTGQYGKTKIVLFHYAIESFNKQHHGAIHLHGHSHGSLPDRGGKRMDVGVDTNNLYPYHLDEILDFMKNRSIKFVDHHQISTN